ncbi:DUF418 domain-containing protein [Polyangium aurulentum]|uniref:DUF418 domain-containing protein n=1 Tax=Polyangium aurulentum TaxID=2567896 RepID=UPI0010ADE597|nr:DUF418 domain-containing protein [Polyangium aurulentum]UQA56348.1 DUF418 domain-containing protein [Polyangium aurulentum]
MPANDARPVDASERLVLIDVIRGFALWGVCISNAYVWFAGRIFMPRERSRETTARFVDAVADFVYGFLVSAKFITIFSFLFGLGFAVQLMRAEKRGSSIVPLYARRLAVMLLFGVVHILALWYGDILHVYALLGFVLLLFRNASERKLLFWGIALSILAMPLGALAQTLLPRLWNSPEEIKASMEAAKVHADALSAAAFADLSGDSYAAVLRQNPTLYYFFFVQRPGSFIWQVDIFGKFLLGFYAGRVGLFQDVEKHRATFRRMLGWGLFAGVIGNGALFVLRHLLRSGRLSPESAIAAWVQPVAGPMGILGLSAFYVASIALLFQRERLRRALSVLAPLGRMALTNYLMQSVFGVLIFYGVGFGLIGKVRPIMGIVIPASVVLLELVWSRFWLARFRFGPVEWLWRSLTYGKAQPMLRARGGAGEGAEPLPASKAP